MRRTLVILILALAATAVIATAAKAYAEESGAGGYHSGDFVLTSCKKGSFERSYCMGYLAAVSDHIISDKARFPDVSSDEYWNFNDVCMPAVVSLGQLTKVWIK